MPGVPKDIYIGVKLGAGIATLSAIELSISGLAGVRLTLYTLANIEDHVLVVKRSYPTSNPLWASAVILRCDAPYFSAVAVRGGCYVFNWSGDMEGTCATTGGQAVPVVAGTWSGIKGLYR